MKLLSWTNYVKICKLQLLFFVFDFFKWFVVVQHLALSSQSEKALGSVWNLLVCPRGSQILQVGVMEVWLIGHSKLAIGVWSHRGRDRQRLPLSIDDIGQVIYQLGLTYDMS